jgi:hypothetical protein
MVLPVTLQVVPSPVIVSPAAFLARRQSFVVCFKRENKTKKMI